MSKDERRSGSKREIADRRARANAGSVRLILAAAYLAGMAFSPVAQAYRWVAIAYFLICCLFQGLILKGIGDAWRPSLGVIADAIVLTASVHVVGSVTTPLVAFYVLMVLMNTIAPLSRAVPNTAAAASIATYSGVVLAEWAGWLSYAPLAPAQSKPVSAQFVMGLAVVVLGVVLSTIIGGRLLAQLRVEMAKGHKLLLNVLPEPIAERLKERSDAIADSLPEVTVLFADVVGFTVMSSKLRAEEVVGMLNRVFTEFDRLAETHGLEKIKTIGDAYMVASGLPEQRADHAEAVADMALGMIEALGKLETPTGDPLQLRIGIHTGPVIAGIIGKRKFSYDLWGDTVNTASRMESHGTAGRIHVTAAVYEKLKNAYAFETRGPVSVKGKGEMTTHFLVSTALAQGWPAESKPLMQGSPPEGRKQEGFGRGSPHPS